RQLIAVVRAASVARLALRIYRPQERRRRTQFGNKAEACAGARVELRAEAGVADGMRGAPHRHAALVEEGAEGAAPRGDAAPRQAVQPAPLPLRWVRPKSLREPIDSRVH